MLGYIAMLNIMVPLLLLVLVRAPLTQADDQHCMNKATKQIPVNVIGDNPNKILTFVRDEPGYAKNLECKWELRANDYSKPRQMLLNVRNVDFDDQTATRDQCNRSVVDVFNFTFTGVSNKGQVNQQSWCSNSDVPKTKKLILANLWNSSNYLTVEFKSDNKQVRSDAKGVEMDVLIMSEDYCHRSMLFHNGSCYLITEDKLNFTEAFEVSKSLLGNLATFSDDGTLAQFILSNKNRANVFPFSEPLSFDQKVWTGHYYYKLNRKSQYQYPDANWSCQEVDSNITITGNCTIGSRIAMQLNNTEIIFTCEDPTSVRLPALIEFKQIPASNKQWNSGMFNTCRAEPTGQYDASSVKTSTEYTKNSKESEPSLFLILLITSLCLITLIAGITIGVCLKRRKKRQEQSGISKARKTTEDDEPNAYDPINPKT